MQEQVDSKNYFNSSQAGNEKLSRGASGSPVPADIVIGGLDQNDERGAFQHSRLPCSDSLRRSPSRQLPLPSPPNPDE